MKLMGNVAIALKVMPSSIEEDLEKIKSSISKKMKIQDAKIEELAFGLKALKILIIAPDSSGTEKIENEIKSIKGVEDVEVEYTTLI